MADDRKQLEEHTPPATKPDGLSSHKPSPEGEGWVRGNKNKGKSLLKSPHPSLLPEGEGAKSTALGEELGHD